MDGKQIVEVREEEDLGIIIQNDVKWSKHCVMVSSSGMVRCTFVYKTEEVIVQLYKSLVRPHLEYCVQAWRPRLKKDIK